MKKLTANLIGILAMAVLITFNTAIAANGSTGTEIDENGRIESSSITPEEMEKLSRLLENMANKIKRGSMTPELQAKSAEILLDVSHMLDVMATPDGSGTGSVPKWEDKEVEKEWNPWDQMVEH